MSTALLPHRAADAAPLPATGREGGGEYHGRRREKKVNRVTGEKRDVIFFLNLLKQAFPKIRITVSSIPYSNF